MTVGGTVSDGVQRWTLSPAVSVRQPGGGPPPLQRGPLRHLDPAVGGLSENCFIPVAKIDTLKYYPLGTAEALP